LSKRLTILSLKTTLVTETRARESTVLGVGGMAQPSSGSPRIERINSGSQTLREAVTSKGSLVHPKRQTRIDAGMLERSP